MSYKRGSYSRSRIISIVLLIVFLFQVCNPMILQAESDQSAIFPRKYINTYTENYIADTSTINANLEENIDIYANEIIVVYKENISDQLGIQSITDNSETDNKNAELSGITIIDDNTVLLKLNPEIAIDEALDDIRKNPEVDYAEPNYRFTTQSSVSDPDYIPNDPKYSEQWGLPEIDAIKAWKESENLRNIEGENPIEPAEVKVAVIDTGVDKNHEDLIGRMVSGRNLITGIADPSDTSDNSFSGHGTHIAGIIAAEADNDKGIIGVVGGLPISIIPVKVLDAAGIGTMYDISKGIRWAADNGAKIINLSLGARLPDYPLTLAQAVEYAQNKGALVIAASGNEGKDVDGFYPACLPGVLAIGASDKDHKTASFSNDYMGDIYVYEAPGVDILSTLPAKGKDTNRYGTMSGTSQAAAFASGIAAVIWSTLSNKNSAEVRESVIQGYKSYKIDYGSTYYYFSVLNAYNALKKLNSGAQPDDEYLEFVNPDYGARVSGEIELSVRVRNPFRVSRIDYELYYHYGESPIAHLGTIYNKNIPESGLVSLKWDTSKITVKEGETENIVDLNDGEYLVKATSYGISGEDIIELDYEQCQLTIVNNQTNGLVIEIKKPDGSKAAEAMVQIIHPYPEISKYGEYSNYETIWKGTADKEGFVSVPGTIANDGNEYTIIAYGTEPAFFYYKTLKSPAKIVMDANDCEKILVSGKKTNGEPLTGADLVMEMPERNIPGLSDPDVVVRLDSEFEDNKYQFPISKLNASGDAELTISKGIYNFYMISPEDKYYLFKKNYQITDTTTNIAFHPNESDTSVIVFEPDSNAYSAALYFNTSEYHYMGIGGLMPKDTITVTKGEYLTKAEVKYQVPDNSLGANKGIEWNWTFSSYISIDPGYLYQYKTGGPLKADIELPLYVDQGQYEKEETAYFYINVTDKYSNPVYKVTKEVYTETTAPVSSADSIPEVDERSSGRYIVMQNFPEAAKDPDQLQQMVSDLVAAAPTSYSPIIDIKDSIGNLAYSETMYNWDLAWMNSNDNTAVGDYTAQIRFDPGPLGSGISEEEIKSNILPFKIIEDDNTNKNEDHYDVTFITKDMNGDKLKDIFFTFFKKDENGKYVEIYDNNLSINGMYCEPGDYAVALTAMGYVPDNDKPCKLFMFKEFTYVEEPITVELDVSQLNMKKVYIMPLDQNGDSFNAIINDEENSNKIPLDYFVYTKNSGNEFTGLFIEHRGAYGQRMETAIFVPSGNEYIFQACARDEWDSSQALYLMQKKLFINDDTQVNLGGIEMVKLKIKTPEEPLNDNSTEPSYNLTYTIGGAALYSNDLKYAPAMFPRTIEDENLIKVTQDIYVTPGDYKVTAILNHKNFDGVWNYWLEKDIEIEKNPQAADGHISWDIGKNFEYSMTLDKETYGIKDKITSENIIQDEYGNRVIAAATNYVMMEYSSMDEIDSLIEAQDHYIVQPFFVIKDNAGTEISREKKYNKNTRSLALYKWKDSIEVPQSMSYYGEPVLTEKFSNDNSFYISEYIIPDDAPGGIYTAALEFAAGPEGLATIEKTFVVNSKPGAPIISTTETYTNAANILFNGTTLPGAVVKAKYSLNEGSLTEAGMVTADNEGKFQISIETKNAGIYSFSFYVEVNGTAGYESAPITVTIDRIAPKTPRNLTGEALDSTHVKLTWDPVIETDFAYYRIYRDNILLKDELTKNAGTVCEYTDSNLEAGFVYSYTLYAVDQAGNQSNGAEVTVKTGTEADIIPPTIPANVNAIYYDGEVKVSWDPSSDNVELKGYNIYVIEEGKEEAGYVLAGSLYITQELPNTSGNLVFSYTALQPETKYTFTVKAFDVSNNESNASQSAEVTTPTIRLNSVGYNIPKIYNNGPAVPQGLLKVRVLGSSGLTGEAQVKIMSLDDGSGGLLEQPVETTIKIDLTEEGDTGLYAGSVVIPISIAEIISIKGILKNQSGKSTEKDQTLNLPVAARIKVMVKAIDDVGSEFLTAARLTAFSSKAGWGTVKDISTFGDYELYVAPQDDYVVKLNAVDETGTTGTKNYFNATGLILAKETKIKTEAGKETIITLNSILPALLNVKLVEEDGITPISGVSLAVVSGDNMKVARGVSDDTGSVRLENAPEKPLYYYLSGDAFVNLINDNEFRKIYYKVETNKISLVPGENEITIKCIKKPVATITGKVTDTRGNPISEAEVTAYYYMELYCAYKAVTDTNGNYSIPVSMEESTKYTHIEVAHRRYATGGKTNVPIKQNETTNFDCFLKPQGKIYFQVYGRRIGEDGETPWDMDIGTASRFRISVQNLSNEKSWYANITGSTIKTAGIYPGDEVEVKIDGTLAGLDVQTRRAIISEDNTVGIDFHMVELSKVKAKIRDEMNAPLVKSSWYGQLINSEGHITHTITENVNSDSYITFDNVNAGTYSAIFYKRPKANTYTYKEPINTEETVLIENIVVEPAKIKDIGSITLPETSTNWNTWFKGEGNSFTTPLEQASPGSVVSLRAEFNCPSFPYEGIQDVILTAGIPELTQLVPDSIILTASDANGPIDVSSIPIEVTEESSGEKASIKVNFGDIKDGIKGALIYRVKIDKYPEWPSSSTKAQITYKYLSPGSIPAHCDVLGKVKLMIPNVSIKTPRHTDTDEITVNGQAPGDTIVKIMDGDYFIGETVSSKYGFWESTVKLADRGIPSIHHLTANIDNPEGGSFISSRKRVDLELETVKLEKIIIVTNGGNTNEINPAQGVYRLPIVWVPRANTWSFKLYFNDNFAVYDVKIKTASGVEAPAVYDNDLKAWTCAVHLYGQTAGAIRIGFKEKPRIWTSPVVIPKEEDIRMSLPDLWRDAKVTVDNVPAGLLNAQEENSGSQIAESGPVAIALDDDGKMKVNMNMQVQSVSSYITTQEELDRIADGAPPVYSFSSSFEIIGDKLKFSIQGIIPDEYANPVPINNGEVQAQGISIDTPGKLVKIFGETAFDGGLGIADLYDTIKSGYDFKENIGKLEGLLDYATSNCNPSAAGLYTDLLNIQAESLLKNLCGKYAMQLIGIGISATGVGVLGGIGVWAAGAIMGEVLDARWESEFNDLKQMIASDEDCKDDEDDDDDDDDNDDDNDDDDDNDNDNDDDFDIIDPIYLIDPSGYVYEAIEDNRLAGVTTTILEQDIANKNWNIWDARIAGQQNPLNTDAEGRYAWDVPEGRWKVLYEKEGYLNAESWEMAVPPPHLDVNVGMASIELPAVTDITAYGGGSYIEFTFSKYMLVETVSNATVTVTNPEEKDEFGSPIAIVGAILPTESYDNPAVPGSKLAIRFKFTPNANLTVGKIYNLAINKAVQNYGGLSMASDTILAVVIPERDIIAEGVTLSSTRLTMNVGNSITLKASILPENTTNKQLNWTTSDSAIATVSNIGVVTAKKAGTARITVTTVSGGKTATCDVTINESTESVTPDEDTTGDTTQPIIVKAAKIQLNKSEIIMNVGDEPQRLIAEILPANTTNKTIIWTSSDISVAIVDKGLVTAVGKGNAIIRASTSDGTKTADCKVIVNAEKPEDETEFRIPEEGYEILEDSNDEFRIKVYPGYKGSIKLLLLNKEVNLEIPEGTFESPEIVTITRSNTPDMLKERNDNYKKYDRLSSIFNIDFGGAIPNKFIRIGILYNTELLSNKNPEKIGVYRTANTGKDPWKYIGGALDVNKSIIYLRFREPALYSLMTYNTTFEDIITHWGRGEIEKLAAKKVISGINDTQFLPDREITRAEFAKLLVTSLIINPYFNIRMTDSSMPLFTDVPKDAWYRTYVDTAAWYGIVKGNEGKYRPNDPITREEMAVMIIRTLNAQEETENLTKNLEFYFDGKVPLTSINFSDKDEISNWALGSVILAQQKGIIKGDSSGNFRPRDNTTRAEAAVVILRAMKQQGILNEPVSITGKLSISEIEGVHYELVVSDENNTRYVIIPSDYILSMKLQALVGKEITITGLLEDEASIYMNGTIFKALSIGSKVDLPCWRCSKESN